MFAIFAWVLFLLESTLNTVRIQTAVHSRQTLRTTNMPCSIMAQGDSVHTVENGARWCSAQGVRYDTGLERKQDAEAKLGATE